MPYKNKEDRKKCQAISRRTRIQKIRENIIVTLGNSCKICGYSDHRALCIDHVNGGGNSERKLLGGSYYKSVLNKILSGSIDYQILCCNCNQIKKLQQEVIRKY